MTETKTPPLNWYTADIPATGRFPGPATIQARDRYDALAEYKRYMGIISTVHEISVRDATPDEIAKRVALDAEREAERKRQAERNEMKARLSRARAVAKRAEVDAILRDFDDADDGA